MVSATRRKFFTSGTALHNGDSLSTRVFNAPLPSGENIIIETCIVAEYAYALVSPVGAIHQTGFAYIQALNSRLEITKKSPSEN